jgi:choline dehydrogenase-like flavoprotein
MYGCHCGAKWNAGEWADEAVDAGCELVTEAAVDQLIIENHQIGGVRGRHKGKPFEMQAKVVVIAAGGIGTPLILQHAGLYEAGHGMTMDATTMVYGITKEKGIGNEPPMTWSYADDEIGYMLSTLIDPWLLYPIIMAQKSPSLPFRWYQWGQMLGVMIKIKDDISGGITFEGEISKPLTERDRFRLNHAANVSREILIKAGANPDTIFMSPLRGTHPSGTVRLCEMLDRDLQTEVKNLFVCDASTFPEALDRPTVLTIIGLGKRLAEHLVQTALS